MEILNPSLIKFVTPVVGVNNSDDRRNYIYDKHTSDSSDVFDDILQTEIKKLKENKIMADNRIPNLKLEDCRIIFKNFSGRADKYNREGDRNFHVIIDDHELAKKLNEDGWNIKQFNATDDGEEPDYHMPIKVVFGQYPPKIFMIAGTSRTTITEETVGMLDYAEITNVDLIINPYQWNINGNTGITAYCKEMWVTIATSEFEDKYAMSSNEVEEVPF